MHSEHIGTGGGHTVIRVPYRDLGVARVGLVDLLEGGLPTSADAPLDIEDLSRGPVPDFRIRPMSAQSDDGSAYYGDFLDDALIGFVPAREIDPYFSFIELVYVPLGSDRIEKLLYDGLALMLGVLPEVHVPPYKALVESRRLDIGLQATVLWVLRAALVGIPLILVFELIRWLRSARGPVSAR